LQPSPGIIGYCPAMVNSVLFAKVITLPGGN
jgi:hypothetical protein